MQDEKTNPSEAKPVDPGALARRDLAKPLPRRFYARVGLEPEREEFLLTLDGKPARTPAKAPLILPTKTLGEAVAAEWQAQGEFIDPRTMPVTRLVNVALDGVARDPGAVIAAISKYGDSDLLCYRAEAPENLVKAQKQLWDPILAASEARLGARFLCGEGILYVAQPERAKAAVRAAVEAVAARPAGVYGLAALHVMTGLSGSVLLALALAAGEISLDAAWAAAHVDEDYQSGLWGADAEAMAKRALRFEDMAAAARLWRLVFGNPA